MAIARPDDRGNLQVIIVNLNGSNHTLQEAMRTVHNMMRRDNPTKTLAPNGNGKAKAKGLAAPQAEVEVEEQEEETLFTPAPDPVEELEVKAAATSTPKKKPTMPKVVMDLDFDSATPTFRDFAAQKKPQDQFDWYMLVTAWMKDYKGVQEIGIDHVYSASRYIGADWILPEDVGQPFRDGRRQGNGYFVKGSKPGLSKITPVGESRVKLMGTQK